MSRIRTMWKRASLVAAAGAAVLASGCAEERPPINQVQPLALAKSFFVGKDYQDASDDPEFYFAASLVDVGYGAAQDGLFTSTWAQSASRIKWVITEDTLFARLTHERIEGSDGKGVRSDLKNEGVIVAAFKIEKHFDIQRAYNPTTGEPLNQIVENTTDRPWYQRDYIRVDWSKNLNTDSYDFDLLSLLGIFGGVEYTPLAYDITDPNDPNAPVFDLENGYFDVTTRAFATPQMVDLSHLGWGIDKFPACFLPPEIAGGSAPAGNCNPVELTIRHSFKRVVPTDYEPVDWDGHRFRAFGAFTNERYGYTRRYGMTDDKWHRFISRYNIWERSHYYADPENMTGAIECYTDKSQTPESVNKDENGDGTADVCAGVTAATGVGGSQCDIYSQKCTLPYRARKFKPIAWYYTIGSNLEYYEPSDWAAHEWDVAFRSAVQTARYVECVRTGGTNCAEEYPILTGQQTDNQDAVWLAREVDLCRRAGRTDCNELAVSLGEAKGFSKGVIALAQMDEALVLCHSPVEANDHPLCGGPRLPPELSAEKCAEARANGDKDVIAKCSKALTARIGDLRFHQVNVIDAPQTPSPWGIMVDADDPFTGEKIAASINVWSHVNDFYAQGMVDVARYIAGELSTEEVTEGEYVRDWGAAVEAAGKGAGIAPMTAGEIERRLADFVGVDVAQLRELRALGQSQINPQQLRRIKTAMQGKITDVAADARVSDRDRNVIEARRTAAIGSQLEAKLTNRYMEQLAGTDRLNVPASLKMDLASPFRGNNPMLQRELRQLRELALAERNACVLEANMAPAPVATANLMRVLEQKFGAFNPDDDLETQLDRAERMRRFIARRLHYNVIAHEAGHSVGLRHNFVSSSDAWGYRPQYWQLRTRNGLEREACTDFDPTGECVGPRYLDPIQQHEADNLIHMFMQSTVMDYAGETTQDFIGLGVYDFAATRLFYGDTIAVHADPSYNVRQPRGTGMIQKADNFGGILGFTYNLGEDGNPRESTSIHYSQLNSAFELIRNCVEVPGDFYKPSDWNKDLYGEFHPVLDGLTVPVNGRYTRCEQQPVDFVPFSTLRRAAASEAPFHRDGPVIDPQGRTRVPYGFATDHWADTGNTSVFRHDNGADIYELFDFFITSQEINHIFDAYRRNRTTFSIRAAANRNLTRYNEKMRDAAKGLSLISNMYRDYAAREIYVDFNTFWSLIVEDLQTNVVASQIAFDHFARLLARPEAGPHYLPVYGLQVGPPAEDGVLRSSRDLLRTMTTLVNIPNGATGFFGVDGATISFGGKLVENTLGEDWKYGEYYNDYDINVGSYYEKIWSAMLMTESKDNYISSSRTDFVDARYRAVSMADLFREGYRRWLANYLTNDDQIRGVRLAADSRGRPLVDTYTRYPLQPIGWTTWTPVDGPEVCFPDEMSLLCDSDTTNTVPVDPQVGWEVQKFLIAHTLLYLPENAKQYWLDRMAIWELGVDADPGIGNRIEFHNPNGRVYVAKRFGREVLFGKEVEKGIAARVLEYANGLLTRGYLTQPIYDDAGRVIGHKAVRNSYGEPVVRYDYRVQQLDLSRGRAGCNEELVDMWENGYVDPEDPTNFIPPHDPDLLEQMNCTCEENLACLELEQYSEIPFFLRQALGTYKLDWDSIRGLY